MSKFCHKCGSPLLEGFQFCEKCGAPVAPEKPQSELLPQEAPVEPQPELLPQEAPIEPQPIKPAGQTPPPYNPPAPQKKSNKGLMIGIVCAAVVIAALLVVFLVPGIITPAAKNVSNEDKGLLPLPADLVYTEGKPVVTCSYDAPEVIVPAIYRSIDYVVFLKCWSDNGKSDLMVSVEIPGFTQKYEQKITVTRAETQLKIVPPIADGAVKTLNSSKDAQLVVSVKDINTGEVIVQDSKPVKLYSRYDMQWVAADGTPYYENYLAWVTPEAPEIKDLLRSSADALSELTGGQYTSIVGYQNMGLPEIDRTEYQAAAMMYALAKYYQVKYVMTPISSTSTELQRCATPAEVLKNRSGICCETAATMASAIQSTGMHAVLILLPGHMQTAVEIAPNSGEYLLIETTALDAAAAGYLRYGPDEPVFKYFSKEQWAAYVGQEGYDVIDCNLAADLKIRSID